MKRRLFFLFPDVARTSQTINELVRNGLCLAQIHVVANASTNTDCLPACTRVQPNRRSALIESLVWNSNLLIFFIAGLLALYLLTTPSPAFATAPIAIMLICFFSGRYYARQVPHIHIADFYPAIEHGKILLMVDIPRAHLFHVERLITRLHPEAVPGGVGWSLEALNV